MYAFLHWESMETPLIAAAILIVFTTVYLGFCALDEKIKWKLVQRRDLKIKQSLEGKKDK